MAGGDLIQSEPFFLLKASCTVGKAESLEADKLSGGGRGGHSPSFATSWLCVLDK